MVCSLKAQALVGEEAIFVGVDKSKMSEKEYEDYLHRIYIQNYTQPVSSEEWSGLVQGLPSKTYQLEYKDNLWDLSGKFFQNSLYWSKLWVTNSHIGNPHRIEKGDNIQFDLEALAPDSGQTGRGGAYSRFVDDGFFQSRVTLSEQDIPASIPSLDINLSFDQFQIDTSNLKGHQINKQAPLPYYLSEEDLSGIGEICQQRWLWKAFSKWRGCSGACEWFCL